MLHLMNYHEDSHTLVARRRRCHMVSCLLRLAQALVYPNHPAYTSATPNSEQGRYHH